jgi:pyruvate-ferredoxin/flavodoxin oxidoreductase
MKQRESQASYPGVHRTGDGSSAVVSMETAASEAAGAYPITPSTQMGEGWASAVAGGKKNVNGRGLIYFEPEGEHAAAGVTAGMSMVGLRSTNFSSGQGIAYMHESLYAAVGKRLTYVLNVACRAMTKHSLNIHAGHDDYHAIDDTGFFQLFARDVQSVADLNLIAHRIAELSLNPGICAQDGFLTSHVIESFLEPERELIRAYLGDPSDMIDTPTAAQRAVFGDKRRRIPELYDFDYPASMGVVQNQESYAQGVAAQRPFYFDHIAALTDQAFEEYARLSGRRYERAMGYRMADADYVIAGQGSVISNAQVVADYLRDQRRLKVGVLDMLMFRPFPADRVSRMLAGKKGVVVLERTDQPLAVELPMIREIRSAMAQALENGRAGAGGRKGGRSRRQADSAAELPYPALAALRAEQVPDFYSGCFGLGSRDLQPGDIIAAVENMLPDGRGQRQFYLGIEFIQKDTPLPKIQIWQEKILADYPQVEQLALPPAGEPDLNPPDALQLRIHSVGGWEAINSGNELVQTAAALLGLQVKAFPRHGAEKRGQPTTYSAVLSKEPLRLNCELRHIGLALAHDPNVFLHSDPLAHMRDGGVLIIQSDLSGAELWNSLPQTAQWSIRQKKIKVFSVDGIGIALSEAASPAQRYRLQGMAFMGAFFSAIPLSGPHGLAREHLIDGLRQRLIEEGRGRKAGEIEDDVHIMSRGYDEIQALDLDGLGDEGQAARIPLIPRSMSGGEADRGIGNPGEFWNQVCAQYKTGNDVLADPFTAISAIPAATSTMRDMSEVRFLVPEFIADKCTGCSKCWVQCPDSAIPGVVNTIEEILDAAVRTVATLHNPLARFSQIIRPLGKASRKIIAGGEFETFAAVLSQAYETVAGKANWNEERRAEVDAQYQQVHAVLAEFPLARTAPFWDLPESKEKGSGGLLSITINPETCKGCDVCVAVCDDGALVSVQQTPRLQQTLESNWKLWKNLPETDDRYVNISSLEESIGVMPSLLLKQSNYMSMLGGDSACMGCGEKTAIHLVLSAVNAFMAPRVEQHVSKLSRLLGELDEKARSLLVSDTDLATVAPDAQALSLPVEKKKKERVWLIHRTIEELKDLKWRYEKGPSGRGRARMGFSNSTGCTSVWGATFPFNPYPFPWVSHLFQDAPSVAVGLFEGHMRKMADGFISLRRAEKLLSDSYDAEADEGFFADFGWAQFSDDEFALCPPLFAVGGDGAMMDIGFQNLSRVMASDKPIRVVVVDTQAYSTSGGQACTAGFTGQISDLAEFGTDQKGKEEVRKELALISMAHRGVFVMQSSQATPSHLFKNLLQGLQARRPAVFILNAPCPREWGIAQDSAPEAARLALESRAVPNVVFDPDRGTTFSECLELEGNPAPEETWTEYELRYRDEEGEEQAMTLPLTIADWALGEARFREHYRTVADEGSENGLVAFHEYLELDSDEREEATPFIFTVDANKQLGKVVVSAEIVALAEERLSFWRQLKELAGVEVSDNMRDSVAEGLTQQLEARLEALKAEYEGKIAVLTTQYPQLIARRLAEGLLRVGGNETVAQLLEKAEAWEGPAFTAPVDIDLAGAPASNADAAVPDEAAAAAEAPAATEVVEQEEDDDDMGSEPYIDTIRCTSCDECTGINNKMFAYNDEGQAYIADARAGTFRQLVMAAESCAPEIIHPGDPLNPDEKGLDKLIKRAEPYN